MMRQYELVDRVAAYNPAVDEALLNKAYVYAMKKHGTQTRASGDPYFSHPLEVAAILTGLHLDDATIVTGLLHDTIEDTDATRSEIDKLFGHEIGELVDGLTKIDRLDLVSKKAEQAENLRKLLIAIAEDVRVLLVKLADRLHNMRTIQFVREEKRRRIAEETMEIYAPLAGRMGMQDMRDELEDHAFRILQPEAYETIAAKREELVGRSESMIAAVESELRKRLEAEGIEAKIVGREKTPYSIFSKMQRKSVGFEQLSDIFGFRVIVSTLAECYRTLGTVHVTWPMVPGRFKDYISIPKQNDYRSLHTTIIGPRNARVELQIRTYEMDRVAEQGIAAHPLYKDGVVGKRDRLEAESRAYAWLRRTVEHIASGDAPEDFLENTKLELFQDQVFCFTPKGALIALPRGANPIDFAYAVHTQIGDTCIGAKVNGRAAPLTDPLSNGDEVEIIRSDKQRPRPEWESVVATGKARAAIRRASRDHVRRQYVNLGRHVLRGALERAGLPFEAKRLSAAARELGVASEDEMLAALGRGELRTRTILVALDPTYEHDANGAGEETRHATIPDQYPARAVNGSQAVPIVGAGEDVPVRFAPNGGAVPGDRIVGILSPGEGVTIYPIQAPDLARFDEEPERWLDVRWAEDGRDGALFPARVMLHAINAPGTLASVAQTIAKSGGNIDNLYMSRRARDFTEMVIDVEVRDLQHLNSLLSRLREKPVISGARRLHGAHEADSVDRMVKGSGNLS